MGRNGLQGGLKNARRPGVCKTWVSNSQFVPQDHLFTRESLSSPGTEPSNYSPCRATALLWQGKERKKTI